MAVAVVTLAIALAGAVALAAWQRRKERQARDALMDARSEAELQEMRADAMEKTAEQFAGEINDRNRINDKIWQEHAANLEAHQDAVIDADDPLTTYEWLRRNAERSAERAAARGRSGHLRALSPDPAADTEGPDDAD